jgi:hypothetical protein
VASILALLGAFSLWLSAGTIAVLGGDTHRIAALPSIWILIALGVAAILAASAAKLRLHEAWPLLISLLVWLPFVPAFVPSAFLIWQGPIEVLVWVVVMAGLMAARPPALPAMVKSADSAPWIAGAIVGIASLVVFNQVRGVIPGGDEPHYLAATQSILKDFDLRVANNYANGEYLDYFPGRLEPHFLKRSTSGDIYSIHAPGVSIVVLPAFAIAGYVGAVLTIILIAAVTAAVTWRLAWRVSGSVAGAWAGVAAVFATTPYFFHSFTIYPEIIGGLCVACGAWVLIELADGRDVAPWSLIAAGAALALLPWLHSRFAVIAVVLGLVIVMRLVARASAIAQIARFLCVPAVAGIAWFAFFWLIWGSPSPIAPYGADTSTSSSYILRGLIGLLVDQQFGLVTTAPIYLLAIAGVVILGQQRPRLTAELLLIVVPYAVAVASYAMWWAGSAAPARFLIAVLPLAALPISILFRAAPGTGFSRWPILTMVLLIVSVGLVLPRAFVEGGRFIYNNRGSIDATFEWLSQSIDWPLALPSVHRDGGTAAIRDAALWLTIFVLVCGSALRMRRRSRAAVWTVMAAAVAITVMTSASLVAGVHGAGLTTPDRSKLGAIAAFCPRWQTTIVDVDRWRILSGVEFLSTMSIDIATPASRISRVPAGEYELELTAASPVPGQLELFVGRSDPPFESPDLDDLHDGRSTFRLRLPVPLQYLNLTTKAEIGADSAVLTLRPTGVMAPVSRRNAVRATRYGHARAFFFDEQAYLERGGFWTRANGRAVVVIDTDEGTRISGLPISISAGAVPTTVTLSVGDWEERLTLAAGQKQDVALPPASDGTWALSIRSGAGFRPSEREPGNRDVRSLAAWIAIH